jgi:chromosomal replication initiation ATPase DnaA
MIQEIEAKRAIIKEYIISPYVLPGIVNIEEIKNRSDTVKTNSNYIANVDVNPLDVIAYVSCITNISVKEMFGRSRSMDVIYAKHLSQYVLYTYNIVPSLNKIAKIFKLDHSTIINARDKIKGYLTYDEKVQEDIKKIESYFSL